jgi:hypothetical protein
MSEWQTGDLLYQNPLDNADAVNGWVAEGPAVVTFPAGRMRLESSADPDEGQAANFLFWCPDVFPGDIEISWEFRPIREPGLAMLWFAASGQDGRDLFDSSLAPRTGEYQQYHSGDINGYHLSYFRRRLERERQFHTCNLRKSHGFHLVASAPDPIPGVADIVSPYRMMLRKIDGRITFFINEMEILVWEDDGRTHGPLFSTGRIGFRQMAPLVADYANLTVSAMVEKTTEE